MDADYALPETKRRVVLHPLPQREMVVRVGDVYKRQEYYFDMKADYEHIYYDAYTIFQMNRLNYYLLQKCRSP